MAQPEHNDSPAPRSSEWDPDPPRGLADPVGRAAALTCTLALVELLVFGLLVGSAVLLAIKPYEEWSQLITAQGIALESTDAVRGGLVPMAMMLAVLGVIPALCLLVLGWRVRQRRVTAANVAQVLTLTQTLVFGIVGVAEMLAAFANGNPSRVTQVVVCMGTLVTLMAYTCKILGDARQRLAWEQRPATKDGEIEP